jgi:hypothetical protein
VTNSGRNYTPSEYLIEDADHLKIRNIQLGYALPPSLIGGSGLDKVRLYVNATNLYTFDGYSGYTPEIGGGVLNSGIDTGVYPTSRTVTVGLDLGF